MKMEEDRGDLNTAASQHDQGTLNLEGNRILLRGSDVGQSKGAEKPLTDSFDEATPAATCYGLGYCGLAASESPVAICMVCAVCETHYI